MIKKKMEYVETDRVDNVDDVFAAGEDALKITRLCSVIGIVDDEDQLDVTWSTIGLAWYTQTFLFSTTATAADVTISATSRLAFHLIKWNQSINQSIKTLIYL